MAERVDYSIHADDKGVARLLKGIGLALERLEKLWKNNTSAATQASTQMKGFVAEGRKITQQLETPLERFNRQLERANFLFQKKAINAETLRRRIKQLNKELKEGNSANISGVKNLIGAYVGFRAILVPLRFMLGQIRKEIENTAAIGNKLLEGKESGRESTSTAVSGLIARAGLKSSSAISKELTVVRNEANKTPVFSTASGAITAQEQLYSSGFEEKKVQSGEALGVIANFLASIGRSDISADEARQTVKSISKIQTAKEGGTVLEAGPTGELISKLSIEDTKRTTELIASLTRNREVEIEDFSQFASRLSIILRSGIGFKEALASLTAITEQSSSERASTALGMLSQQLSQAQHASPRKQKFLTDIGIDPKNLAKTLADPEGGLQGAIGLFINAARIHGENAIDKSVFGITGTKSSSGFAAMYGEAGKKAADTLKSDFNPTVVKQRTQEGISSFRLSPASVMNKSRVNLEFAREKSARDSGGYLLSDLKNDVETAQIRISKLYAMSSSEKREAKAQLDIMERVINLLLKLGYDESQAQSIMEDLLNSPSKRKFATNAALLKVRAEDTGGLFNDVGTENSFAIEQFLLDDKRRVVEREIDKAAALNWQLSPKDKRRYLYHQRRLDNPYIPKLGKKPTPENVIDPVTKVPLMAPGGGGSVEDPQPVREMIITESPTTSALLDEVRDLNITMKSIYASQPQKVDVGIPANELNDR